MDYRIATDLKLGGFLQRGDGREEVREVHYEGEDKFTRVSVYIPTMVELIAACGEVFGGVRRNPDSGEWLSFSAHEEIACHGRTPEDAVAGLWLQINKQFTKAMLGKAC